LFDVPEPLKVGVSNDFGDNTGWDGNEAVNRIVDYFLLVHPKNLFWPTVCRID
jgi:hypothetical protein